MIETLNNQRTTAANNRRDEFGLPNIDKEKFASVFPNLAAWKAPEKEEAPKPYWGLSKDYLMQRGEELKSQGYGRDEVGKFLQQEIKGNKLNLQLGRDPEPQIGSFNANGEFVRDTSTNAGNESKARNDNVFGIPPTIDGDSQSQVSSIDPDRQLSVRDLFELNAAQYQDTDPETANEFMALNNDYWELQQSFNNIVNGFGVLEKLGTERLNQTWLMSNELGKRLTDELLAERDNFLSKYWDDWELRKQMDDSYRLRAQLIKDARGEAWARAVSQTSGAGLWANAQARARQEAERGYWDDLSTLEEQKIKDYDALYTKVNNFQSQFRTELGNTTDKYLIQTYKDITDWKNSLWESLLNSVNALEQARINLQLARENNSAASAWASSWWTGAAGTEYTGDEMQNWQVQAYQKDGRLQSQDWDIPFEWWISDGKNNYSISIVDGQPVMRWAEWSMVITKEQAKQYLDAYWVNL